MAFFWQVGVLPFIATSCDHCISLLFPSNEGCVLPPSMGYSAILTIDLQDPQLCIPVEMCDALYCRAGFENSYKLNTSKFQNELNR
jgi:hypothetical protein